MMVKHVQMTPVLLSVGLRLRNLPDTRGLVLLIQHPPPPHLRSQLLALLRMWWPVSTAPHPGYPAWEQGAAKVRVFIYRYLIIVGYCKDRKVFHGVPDRSGKVLSWQHELNTAHPPHCWICIFGLLLCSTYSVFAQARGLEACFILRNLT